MKSVRLSIVLPVQKVHALPLLLVDIDYILHTLRLRSFEILLLVQHGDVLNKDMVRQFRKTMPNLTQVLSDDICSTARGDRVVVYNTRFNVSENVWQAFTQVRSQDAPVVVITEDYDAENTVARLSEYIFRLITRLLQRALGLSLNLAVPVGVRLVGYAREVCTDTVIYTVPETVFAAQMRGHRVVIVPTVTVGTGQRFRGYVAVWIALVRTRIQRKQYQENT